MALVIHLSLIHICPGNLRMIDRETIDRIYAAANIVEIIGDYVTLRRKGVNYQACCPFHNEKTPSFVVSPSKGVFKCFGCRCV